MGHACLEAGFKFQKPDMTIHMVVVSVESHKQLLAALEGLSLRDIQYVVFFEPDDALGFTAACTEPLNSRYRREFRDFPLWNLSREVIKT